MRRSGISDIEGVLLSDLNFGLSMSLGFMFSRFLQGDIEDLIYRLSSRQRGAYYLKSKVGIHVRYDF